MAFFVSSVKDEQNIISYNFFPLLLTPVLHHHLLGMEMLDYSKEATDLYHENGFQTEMMRMREDSTGDISANVSFMSYITILFRAVHM